MPVTWQSPRDVKDLSPSLCDWLLNTGSLTERLQALTHHFSVDLLGQQVADMDESERRHLHHSDVNEWQIREVILQGSPRPDARTLNAQTNALGGGELNSHNTENWVFARSVLPNELCESKWANLGSQPLGSRIFNDNKFIRSEFEIGKLHYHPITHEAFSANQPCWARRSKFTIQHYELLVAEAFLPHSPCYW